MILKKVDQLWHRTHRKCRIAGLRGFNSGVIQHLALLLCGVSQQVSISHWSLKTSADINQKHSITPEHLIALTDISHPFTGNVCPKCVHLFPLPLAYAKLKEVSHSLKREQKALYKFCIAQI